MTEAVLAEAYEALVQRSRLFAKNHVQFPTQYNLVESIVAQTAKKDGAEAANSLKQKIASMAKSTRPVLHKRTWDCLEPFLKIKQKHGTPQEQKLYQDMTPASLVTRFLSKRPLAFLTRSDQTLFRNGRLAFAPLDNIRSQDKLEEYMSYDEVLFSALVGVSSPTIFINSGARNNVGRVGEPGTFEAYGIYTGLVGARFERHDQMESRYLVVDASHTAANGFGPRTPQSPNGHDADLLCLIADLLGVEYLPTFEQAETDRSGRYQVLSPYAGTRYLDTHLYMRRIELSMLPFLVDANERALAAGTSAYVHVVGLGLGVWQVHASQARWFVKAVQDTLLAQSFSHIANIDFSWFPDDAGVAAGWKDGDAVRTADPGHRVRVHFSSRSPAQLLTGEDAGKLLVASYAWDGNSFPGNEYWRGMLAASGDPAAACCSCIPELQNSVINPDALTGEHALITK